MMLERVAAWLVAHWSEMVTAIAIAACAFFLWQMRRD
jgi:hypothetical protein